MPRTTKTGWEGDWAKARESVKKVASPAKKKPAKKATRTRVKREPVVVPAASSHEAKVSYLDVVETFGPHGWVISITDKADQSRPGDVLTVAVNGHTVWEGLP